MGPVYSASGKAHLPLRYPRGTGYVVIATVPGGQNGQMQSFVGLGFLLLRTYVIPIPGLSHTGIGLFPPGRPATTSLGCN